VFLSPLPPLSAFDQRPCLLLVHPHPASDPPAEEVTTILFLSFVAAMAGIVIALSVRYLGRRLAIRDSIALLAWLACVGLIGHAGIIRNTSLRPPGMAFLFVPVLLFLAVFVGRTLFSAKPPALATFPPGVLLGLQSFRVIVELFLHQLWLEGLIPRMLTYSGANLDIYVGATAPLIAWVATRWKGGRSLSILWNGLGLLILANVVIRAVLTAPGPLNLVHAEVPNLMIGTFPFMYIPGFFVPLAVVLHVAAWKAACGAPVPRASAIRR
jgi:hypothetical protein